MRERVADRARELGFDVQVRRLDASTRTVRDAARAVGCEEAEIAKSIVFVADGDPILCIASGKHRIDPERLCLALDCAEARQASAAEVRAATGYGIGGVPPFGHGLPVLLDGAAAPRARLGRGRRPQQPVRGRPARAGQARRRRVATVGE